MKRHCATIQMALMGTLSFFCASSALAATDNATLTVGTRTIIGGCPATPFLNEVIYGYSGASPPLGFGSLACSGSSAFGSALPVGNFSSNRQPPALTVPAALNGFGLAASAFKPLELETIPVVRQHITSA